MRSDEVPSSSPKRPTPDRRRQLRAERARRLESHSEVGVVREGRNRVATGLNAELNQSDECFPSRPRFAVEERLL